MNYNMLNKFYVKLLYTEFFANTNRMVFKHLISRERNIESSNVIYQNQLTYFIKEHYAG